MGIFTLCFSSLLLAHVVQSQAYDPLDALSTDNPAVQKEIVDLMNKLRCGVEPPASNMLEVVWNKEAAQNAARWANKCSFKHSEPEDRKIPNYSCGENLFMASYGASWNDAIMSFYKERHNFIYGKGPKNPKSVIGHYTQLAWAASWNIGCAVARCPGKEWEYFYVCQQCPAGNNKLDNNFPYNTGKKCGDCPNNCKNDLCTNPCPKENVFSNCNTMTQYCKVFTSIENGCLASCNCQNKIF